MLKHLLRFTNSPAFVERGYVLVLEVRCRPGESADVFLTLDLRLADEYPLDETSQVWQVRCVDAPSGFHKGLPTDPSTGLYHQLRVYRDHPVLMNYAHGVEIEVQGQCPNVPALLGALYEAHGKACGHWVDFSGRFSGLAHHLRVHQRVDLLWPKPLLDVYGTVFSEHGLTHTVQGSTTSVWLAPPLRALIFSNPLVSPDEFNKGQPYQVAQAFEERRIA